MSEPVLKLFNSLTRAVEIFEPVHQGEARVYSCGPTVYNYPHIGNMRAYVFADILGRTLRLQGYDLRHIINITDVGHLTDDADDGEDKMEKMASEKAQSIWDIAAHYTEAFKADVRALNIREPAEWTVATDFVDAMIDFVQSMPQKHVYEIASGLYFDTATVADYGRLARAVTEEGGEESRGRIEAVEGKRNAADFALWRKTPPGEKRQMEWDSPWGKGAPGWHLECSVMGQARLGFPFDIHTGGIDHREIHHPNEIAQNQAFCGCGSLDDATHSGAKIWMHNNFLVERSGKMSKSSGEFLRLQLLIDKGFHPLAYRLLCLQAHYRSELEFSWDGLRAALVRLKRIVMGVERLLADPRLAQDAAPAEPGPKLEPLMERFADAVCDDLNTAIALTVLEEVIAFKKVHPASKLAAIYAIDQILGFGFAPEDCLDRATLRIRPANAKIDEAEIAAALEQRRAARAASDFAKSDAIRDDLAAAGVEVMDGDALGWDWKL